MLTKSPAYRESNPIASGDAAEGGTGIVSVVFAVRVAGLQHAVRALLKHLSLNVEFPLGIRDFAGDYYKDE
jgi:hypothetical protein